MNEPHFQRVLPLDELRPGRMHACRIGARDVVICRTDEGVFALDDVCTHAEARMSEGRLRGTRLVCPLHGAVFDVRDGRVLKGPAVRPLGTHAVRIRDGAVEIAVGCEPGG